MTMKFWEALPPSESVTVTVTVRVPATVGVPETVPVVAFIVRPAGKLVADHVNGAWPLVLVSAALYTTPTAPLGSVPLIVGRDHNVRFSIRLALAPAASVTVMLMLNGPATVGVPEMTPVLALMAMPLGRPLAAHVYGGVPCVAAIGQCCRGGPARRRAVSSS